MNAVHAVNAACERDDAVVVSSAKARAAASMDSIRVSSLFVILG